MTTTKNIYEELEEVVCSIRPYDEPFQRYPLIDYEKISEKLSEDITNHLKSAGVKAVNGYEMAQFGATGGSFWYELLELLKAFRLIGAVIQTVKAVRFAVEKTIDNEYRKSDIRITISLSIGSSTYADETTYFRDDIGERLAFMFRMAQTEAIRLTKEYPLYTFGARIGVSLSKNNYSCSFSSDDFTNLNSYKRMCNIASKFRLVNGVSYFTTKARFGLFKHSISRMTLILDSPHYKHDYRSIKDSKSFYTLISNTFVGQFWKNRNKMSYESYYKKYLASSHH
jgi:hypothetical protein